MAGGPILPSSVDVYTLANSLAWEEPYLPATITNGTGAYNSVFFAASIGSNVPITLLFDLPEVIPSGTAKLRILSQVDATTGVFKITVADGVNTAGNNPGTVTLTTETQVSQTVSAADVVMENKVTLSSTMTANGQLIVLVTANNTGWTLAANLANRFMLVWE